jgi:hypothetical protein
MEDITTRRGPPRRLVTPRELYGKVGLHLSHTFLPMHACMHVLSPFPHTPHTHTLSLSLSHFLTPRLTGVGLLNYGRKEESLIPWIKPWLDSGGPMDDAKLLPMIREAGISPTQVWAWLGTISKALTPTALCTNERLQPNLHLPSPLGTSAFLHPSMELKRQPMGRRRVARVVESLSLCMEYDEGKVKKVDGLRFEPTRGASSYLKCSLGPPRGLLSLRREVWDLIIGPNVTEYGHRLVAWSMFAPPLEGQEVLHTCHNCKCLSPLHLKYGSHHENMGQHFGRRGKRPRK